MTLGTMAPHLPFVGRKQLEAELANWERLTEAVALILRTAE